MEYWDLYDKDRIKLNKKIKAGTSLLDGEFRLVAHLCIFNHKNQLLIQKRHSGKSLYPGCWDLSLSGSVQAGEDSRQAMVREAKEELGLQLSLDKVRVSLSFNFDEGFDDFYFITQDLDLNTLSLQVEEVTQVMWASELQVLALIEQNHFIPYHPSLISLLFFNKDAMRIHTR